jgi:hypothetical protein
MNSLRSFPFTNSKIVALIFVASGYRTIYLPLQAPPQPGEEDELLNRRDAYQSFHSRRSRKVRRKRQRRNV